MPLPASLPATEVLFALVKVEGRNQMSGTRHKERSSKSLSGSMSDSIWQGSLMGMVGWGLKPEKRGSFPPPVNFMSLLSCLASFQCQVSQLSPARWSSCWLAAAQAGFLPYVGVCDTGS